MQTTSFQQLETLLFFTLGQLMVIIVAARLMGAFAQRIGQPRAVGEIIAGLLLGPSLLGSLAPDLFNALFKAGNPTPLTIMSQIGLILLMFQVGLEFDFSSLIKRAYRKATFLITAAGISIPFIIGFSFGTLSQPMLASGIDPLAYSLFIAIALSITAVPILGRILMEFQLTRHQLGVITIAAAAANDAIGWILLTLVAAIANHHLDFEAILQQIAGLMLYLVGAFWLIRPLLLRLLNQFPLKEGRLPPDLLAILLVIIFGSAMITSHLGIFAIFGGFVAGLILHQRRDLARAWEARVNDFLSVFFLPIFFTYTGLRTDIGSLQSLELWGWCALLLALAFAAKLGGCFIAARFAGLNQKESLCIGIMMNTRALMELIVINLGHDLGVIPPEVFTMLVIMAISSTLLTAPGLRCWLPKELKKPGDPSKPSVDHQEVL
ncbi:MAG: sodium:proton antiporter [Gammaproteobacteria bacterium]|nr:sodium:proton antiporter [Gammaproteobacteria bacterium]NBT44025.1 sodium:proton antiporter [Gammaproteobacteria bacterium]NBY21489.1 sodium:proton antiporter [Gammaproteobacteria bacterium]